MSQVGEWLRELVQQIWYESGDSAPTTVRGLANAGAKILIRDAEDAGPVLVPPTHLSIYLPAERKARLEQPLVSEALLTETKRRFRELARQWEDKQRRTFNSQVSVKFVALFIELFESDEFRVVAHFGEGSGARFSGGKRRPLYADPTETTPATDTTETIRGQFPDELESFFVQLRCDGARVGSQQVYGPVTVGRRLDCDLVVPKVKTDISRIALTGQRSGDSLDAQVKNARGAWLVGDDARQRHIARDDWVRLSRQERLLFDSAGTVELSITE